MILPFNETIVNDGEINSKNFKYPNFAGFLNPDGIPISFRDRFGITGHGEAFSIQERFRVYYPLKIRDYEGINLLEKYIMSYEYLNSERERNSCILKELVKDKKEILFPSVLDKLEIDVYNFLINCYKADTFFDGVGKVETCMCECEFLDKEYKKRYMNYDFDFEYTFYKYKILADVYKNVMIQYLGYHSVERIPRTITTSSFNIYETFYNYLLNDFTIYRVPKMIFDYKEKKYIQLVPNDFYVSDSELRLKDEIKAIKKLVPIEERSKYYR